MWIHSWLLMAHPALSAPIRERPFTSIHEQHAEQFGDRLQPAPPTDRIFGAPAPAPQITVYGYHPYWGPDPTTLDFSRLTHLAIFNVDLNADGTLADTQRWTDVAGDVVPLAHAEGVSVQLCITSFDDNVMASVLPDPTKRAVTIAQLVDLVDSYGADGVNVDFEGLDYELKDDFSAFIEELYPQVTELTIALPAIDWVSAYDYDRLALSSDGLFIMGYGYHWSGGNPGPVAPLYGGSPWNQYSLEWSVDDYLTWGATRDKLILGLPLYGTEWPTSSHNVPGTATGTGWSVFMSNADDIAAEEGREWDDTTLTPYILRDNSQVWYDNTESIQYRIQWAIDADLQGIGFWALGYESENTGFWEMVSSETGWGDPKAPNNEPPIAVITGSQLAYPGIPFQLDGSSSMDPEGEMLRYTWTQTRGPELEIASWDSPILEAIATESGAVEMTLKVHDGTQDSAVERISIVVVDPEAGNDVDAKGQCGNCSAVRLATGSWLAGLMLLWTRFRRD